MKNHKWLVIFFAICPLFSLVFAQKQEKIDDKFGFHFKRKHQRYAKIPFELSSNLIVVKITIDKSDTLNFILDTGVASTIISDPKVATKLGLKFVRTVQISGAGEGKTITGSVSVDHQFMMNDVIANRQNLVVLSEDILQLSQFLGMPIHGIFGHDLFARFVVSIDFYSRNITLFEPKHFRHTKFYGQKIPITVTNSKPYTDAFILKNGGVSTQSRLVIDTGAGHSLLLNPTADQRYNLMPQKLIRANLGRGLNGEINGNLGRVESIQLGKFLLKDVIASFPDSTSFADKFSPEDGNRQGSIGCELLRRFRVTLNYLEGYMAIKPDAKRIKETFEYDMSGLDIRAKGDDYKRYFVEKVVEKSPAEDAGLQSGDELIFMNKKSINELTINEIYKTLVRKEKELIRLVVRRNGELVFFEFYLKRFI